MKSSGGSFRESSSSVRKSWLIKTGKEKTNRTLTRSGGRYRESSISWLIRAGKEKTSRRWTRPEES